MPPHPAIRQLCAPLVLLVCGCAPLEWQKSGAAAADIGRDQARCTAQARLEARQRMPMQANPAPQVIVDRQGRTIVTQNTQPDSERFFLENSLLRQCMTQLGYSLQPPATAVRPE